MEFKPVDNAAFLLLQDWFKGPTLRRWYCPPTAAWFEYVINDPNVYCWLAYENDSPIGLIQLDVANDTGSIGYLVKPELRRQGIGKRMISEFLRCDQIPPIKRVVAEVEEENVASVRCAIAAGFGKDCDPPSEKGFVRLSVSLDLNE